MSHDGTSTCVQMRADPPPCLVFKVSEELWGFHFEVYEGSSGLLGGSFGAPGGPGSMRGLRERLEGVLGPFRARPWEHPNHYFWEANML